MKKTFKRWAKQDKDLDEFLSPGDYIDERSQNIDYANANAIAKYISAYLFDVLEDVGNNEYVAMYLRGKGYEVTKQK